MAIETELEEIKEKVCRIEIILDYMLKKENKILAYGEEEVRTRKEWE